MGCRKLSSLERYFYTRSVLGLHSCFYVGIQLDWLPCRAQLKDAIETTIATFIELRCNVRIDAQDHKPYLKIIDQSFTFDDVVEFLNWVDFDEDKINYVFQNYFFSYHTEKPLWKLLIIPNVSKLVLLMSHVLFDGISGVMILQEFSKNLRQSVNTTITSNVSTVYVPNEFQCLAKDHHPYEELSVTWKTKLSHFLLHQYFKWKPITADMLAPENNEIKFINYSFPQGLLKKNLHFVGAPHQVRNDNIQWNIRLTSQELQKVLHLCRDHRVSFTSFLTALLSISLIKNGGPASFSGTQLKITIPVNTRLACDNYLQNGNYANQLGNFVAALTLTSSGKDEKPLWELAQTFFERSRNIKIYDAICDCKILDVLDSKQLLEAKITASNPGDTFEVSNLGFQHFNNVEGPIQIVDAFFNQPQGISANFFCSVISTEGGLNCHITFPRDLKKDLTSCMQYVGDWLHKAGKA